MFDLGSRWYVIETQNRTVFPHWHIFLDCFYVSTVTPSVNALASFHYISELPVGANSSVRLLYPVHSTLFSFLIVISHLRIPIKHSAAQR